METETSSVILLWQGNQWLSRDSLRLINLFSDEDVLASYLEGLYNNGEIDRHGFECLLGMYGQFHRQADITGNNGRYMIEKRGVITRPIFPFRTISSCNDIIRFANFLHDELDLIFHPDESFSEYINLTTGEKSFTDSEAKFYDDLMQQCFVVAEVSHKCIYELMNIPL